MEIKFITEGMACSKCEARVTERLSSMPGVSSVVATASDGAVVVNGENLNRDELAQAIEDLGYDVIEEFRYGTQKISLPCCPNREG